MKKVGILTLYDMDNYGNRLQNYAMQKIVETFGFKVYTFVMQSRYIPIERRVKHFLMKLTNYRLMGNTEYWKNGIFRYYSFRRDCRRWNHLYYCKADKKYLEKRAKKFDYFVIGSDQVWNPEFYNHRLEIGNFFLASFVAPEKRIAVAPSFGIEALPEEWKEIFAVQLKKYAFLSCREQKGVEIIKALTGRNAEVLVDPTLMLDAEEWNKISRKPKQIDCDCKYVLVYFLGPKPKSVMNFIKSIKGMKIYFLAEPEFQELYHVGPSGFLYLISHASLVLTDSFHACVFSFLYTKPFLVYSREGTGENTFSRIETFLEIFHLQRKYVNSGEENDVFECDYKEGKKTLEKVRGGVLEQLHRVFQKE